MSDERRLSPDTKWLLPLMGAIAMGIVGVTQYQLSSLQAEQLRLNQNLKDRMDRIADLTLERAKGAQINQNQLDQALRPRDDLLKTLIADVNELRVGRAKQSQALTNLNAGFDRVINIIVENQKTVAGTSGQLKLVLEQAQKNTQLVNTLLDQHRLATNSLSERLTRLETVKMPVGRSGTP